MIEESIIALINKDLDGMASAEESSRVQEICAGNEEARKLAEDLRALAHGLAAIERAVPPPTLRPAIMRSIAAVPTMAHSRLRDSFLRNRLRAPGSWRPAMVFAGGVAAGLVLFAMGSRLVLPGNLDESDLVGSLAVHGSTFSAGRVVEFRNGDMFASVQTGTGSEHAIVRIRLDVPPGTTVILAYGHAGGSVETVDVAKAKQAEISLEQGRVVIKGISSGEVGVLLSGKEEVLVGARLMLSDGHGGEWGIALDGTAGQ
jgi:hypothetical protein